MMKKKVVPLTELKEGETGTIVDIVTGSPPGAGGYGRCRGRGFGLKMRLMEMGLTPGTKVTVVKSARFCGPIEILVRDTRVLLGRGMAERVLVEAEEKGE